MFASIVVCISFIGAILPAPSDCNKVLLPSMFRPTRDESAREARAVVPEHETWGVMPPHKRDQGLMFRLKKPII